MKTVNIITITRGSLSAVVLRLVSPLSEGEASHLAGQLMDRLADNTGLYYGYTVRPAAYAEPSVPIALLHEMADAGDKALSAKQRRRK